jgi:heterodisulfide reductase subunit B
MIATQVSYYPGCSLDGTAREYGESVREIAATLGIELRELPDWNCCGASSGHFTDDNLALALAARNLVIADKDGLDLVIPCAACYSRLKTAEKGLRSGKDIEGIPDTYRGNYRILHLTEFLWENIGEAAIIEHMKHPLEGLSPVCYYGCLITRPPDVTGAIDPDNPEAMDNIMATLGADVRNWSYKTDCCGASHMLTLPQVAIPIIQKIFDMAMEAGADSIVVGCPMCYTSLDSMQGDISRETGREYGVPIFFITELMSLAFGVPVEKHLGRHTVDPRPLLRQKRLL